MPETIPVLFDIELMRPGCVLLAATYGASSDACKRFNSEQWLTNPTPGLKVYITTESQLDQLVKMVNAKPHPRLKKKAS